MRSLHEISKFAFAALALTLAAAPCVALAGDHGVALTITVRDATAGNPLRAVITLSGDVNVAAISDEAGKARVVDLPGGAYDVSVKRKDYTTVTRHIVIEAAADATMDVRLVPIANLKQIGSVSVRQGNPKKPSTLEPGSAMRVLTPSVADGLAAIPGVAFERGQNGNATTISLEGHDPTQTSVALNGVPLNVPGFAAHLSALDFDLIERVSVNYGPAASGNGGGVSLQTLQPTRVWQTSLDTSYASFARSLTEFAVQGTTGEIGIAFKHASRQSTSALNGAVFTDASGLDYAHAGGAKDAGDALMLTSKTGAHALALQLLSTRHDADAICTFYTNRVPCGFGPGNTVAQTFSLIDGTDTFPIGQTVWTATGYRLLTSTNVNMLAQRIAQVGIPYESAQQTATTGFSVSGQNQNGKHSTSLQIGGAYASVATSASNGVAGGAFAQRQRFATFSLSDRYKLNRRLTVVGGTDVAAVSGTTGSVTGNLGLQLTGHNQTASLVATAGRGFNTDGSTTSLTQPGGLQINCDAHTAIGVAPGAAMSSNAFAELRAAWSAELPAGTISVQAFDERVKHGSLNTLVDAAALPPGSLPADYLGGAGDIYHSASNCGTASTLRALQLSTVVSDVDLVYQGVHLSLARPLGHFMTAQVSAAVTRAAAWSTNPLLAQGQSVFTPGAQLRGVPIVSAFASFAYKSPVPWRPEIFAGIRYAGAGNASQLPPYSVVDVAVRERVRRGEFTVLVTNLFASYAGTFATPRFAVPEITRDGSTIAGVAGPNAPRSVQLAYSVALGRDARAIDRLASTFAPGGAGASDVIVPGTLVARWALTAPSDPFRRNPGTKCTAEQGAAADGILASLRATVAQAERAKVAGAYPASLPAAIADVGGVSIRYAATANGYALTIPTTRISATQAVVDCLNVHIGTIENARAASVPFPTELSLTGATFYYAPSQGIYYVQLPPPPDLAQKFRTYGVPAQPPSSPFATANADLCRPELAPIATGLLHELHDYLTPAAASGKTASWKITRHSDTAGIWFDLASDEIGATTSLLNCAHVVSATRDQLIAAGVGAAPPPAFNYAPAIGLYIVKGK